MTSSRHIICPNIQFREYDGTLISGTGVYVHHKDMNECDDVLTLNASTAIDIPSSKITHHRVFDISESMSLYTVNLIRDQFRIPPRTEIDVYGELYFTISMHSGAIIHHMIAKLENHYSTRSS